MPYITGGSANLTMGVAEAGFNAEVHPLAISATISTVQLPATFAAIAAPLVTRLIPGAPGAVLLKIGSLDNPTKFIGPDAAIYTDEKQISTPSLTG